MAAVSINDLNNAKLDVDHMAAIATSDALNATDRLGHTKKTLAGLRDQYPNAEPSAEIATSMAAVATDKAATAISKAEQTAGDAASSAADRLLAQAAAIASSLALTAKDTIAIGRAAVGDGATFWVKPNTTDGLTRYTNYLRTSSTTQTFVADQITGAEFDSRLVVTASDSRLIVFVDGSPDQVELGYFGEDGTWYPNKHAPNVANLITRYSNDVTDGSGDLYQIADATADEVLLLRIKEDGTIAGKFEFSAAAIEAQIAAVAATANAANATANAALAAVGGGPWPAIRMALLRHLFNPLDSTPLGLTATVGASVPSGATKVYAKTSPVFNFYGGVPLTYATDLYRFGAKTASSGVGNTGSGYNASNWCVEIEVDSSSPVFVFNAPGEQAYVHFVVNEKFYSVEPTPLRSDSSFSLSYVSLPLSGRGPHRIKAFGSGYTAFKEVRVGVTESAWRPEKMKTFAAIGDSHTGGAEPNSAPDFVYGSRLSQLLGLGFWNLGVGGTGYVEVNGTDQPFGAAYRVADAVTAAADLYLFAGSGNDGSSSVSAVRAAARSAWQAYRAALPGKPFIIFGLHASSSGPDATTLNLEAGLAAEFVAWADPLSVFVPMSGATDGSWLFGTGYLSSGSTTNGSGNTDLYIGKTTLTDRTHMSDAGHLYHGRRKAEVIKRIALNT